MEGREGERGRGGEGRGGERGKWTIFQKVQNGHVLSCITAQHTHTRTHPHTQATASSNEENVGLGWLRTDCMHDQIGEGVSTVLAIFRRLIIMRSPDISHRYTLHDH